MTSEHTNNPSGEEPHNDVQQKPQEQESLQKQESPQEESNAGKSGETEPSTTATPQQQPAAAAPPRGTQTPGTLFGADQMQELKSEELKKKEAEAEARKNQSQEAARSANTPKTFPEGTELRYSGHSKVLDREMTEAQVFDSIADDFPEVEKGRYTLRHDEEKGRIVPVPQAQKKGTPDAIGGAASGHESIEVRREPPRGTLPPVYRLLCADGVYEVRTNRSGSYVVRLDSGVTLAEGYYPVLPRAPATLLEQVVEVFKDYPDTEALIHVVYDRRAGAFCLVWNQDSASTTSVDYHPLPDDEDLVVYAELHSHHKMPAYFSATDDASERKPGVYGVLGRITDTVPEARFRYSCGGQFRELLAEDLFDDPSTVARTVRRPV